MRKYLRELREHLNLTQQEVACQLNVSESYYCLIEIGERQKKLSIDMARKFADVFGVSLEYICDHENQVAGGEMG